MTPDIKMKNKTLTTNGTKSPGAIIPRFTKTLFDAFDSEKRKTNEMFIPLVEARHTVYVYPYNPWNAMPNLLVIDSLASIQSALQTSLDRKRVLLCSIHRLSSLLNQLGVTKAKRFIQAIRATPLVAIQDRTLFHSLLAQSNAQSHSHSFASHLVWPKLVLPASHKPKESRE